MNELQQRIAQLRQQQESNAMAKKPDAPTPTSAADTAAAQIQNVIDTLNPTITINVPAVYDVLPGGNLDRQTDALAAAAAIPRDANVADAQPATPHPTGGQRVSLGRMVIYESDHPQGPYMAHVCFVHADGMHVNLTAFNHHGYSLPCERVKYGTGRNQWHWPPRV